MPLQNFWRRLFHPEIEFQVLKSHSAVELTCYSTATPHSSMPIHSNRRRTSGHQKGRKNASGFRSSSVGRDVLESGSKSAGRPRQLNPIPRYYSHYESFGCSPPMAQMGSLEDTERCGEGRMIDKTTSSFSTIAPAQTPKQQKSCILFSFIESKQPTALLSAKSLGPEELAAALLEQDEKPREPAIDENLRSASTLCQQYQHQVNFDEAVLLKSVESESVHSYVTYASFTASDGQTRLDLARHLSMINRKSARDMKYRQQQGAYEELYSIVRKPGPFESRLPSGQYAGHIVVGYKLLTVDNLEQLECTWLQWSGAGEIARHAPKQWHLKRITFHRQIFTLQEGSGGWIPAPDGFTYVLLCEFDNLMEPGNVVMGCALVERLRSRNCGHVGIYKVQRIYTSPSEGSSSMDNAVTQEYCDCGLEREEQRKLSPVASDDGSLANER